MTERTQITNFLLLSVLFGILLVSGSLQCAFDCLTRTDAPAYGQTLHEHSTRVDTCHLSIDHTAPNVGCLNKACHQRLPYQRDLGGPEIFRLVKLAQPLHGTSRQSAPALRAGSAFIVAQLHQQPQAQLQRTSSDNILQTLFSIRTTVLLC